MSIILQHEFWDLVVTPEAFEVSLNFSRRPERLTVPFDASPGSPIPPCLSASSSSRGSPPNAPAGAAAGRRSNRAANAAAEPAARSQSGAETDGDASRGAEKPSPTREGAAKVVSIDAFRKK